MRCIFCKCDSTNSKSKEHIIPESLGNISHILSPGIVCDKCNNYMSREVEKPFLEDISIKGLRFEEGVLSKKGRIPTVNGLLMDQQGLSPISLARPPELPGSMLAQYPLIFEIKDGVLPSNQGRIIIPKFDASILPGGLILSRFLGKIALEVLALRLSKHPEGLEYLVDEIQLDDLRNHARYGKIANWPCSIRQIYDKNIPEFDSETGQLYQIMNEFDILLTERTEYYLVLAIWGIELAINIGGPEISGYYEWLRENDGKSPLYVNLREHNQHYL